MGRWTRLGKLVGYDAEAAVRTEVRAEREMWDESARALGGTEGRTVADTAKVGPKVAEIAKDTPSGWEKAITRIRQTATGIVATATAVGIGLWAFGSEKDPNKERTKTAQEVAAAATAEDIKSGQTAALEEFRRIAKQNGSDFNQAQLQADIDKKVEDFKKANPKATQEQINKHTLETQLRVFTDFRTKFEENRKAGGVDKLHVPNKPDELDAAPGIDFKLVIKGSRDRYQALKIVPTMPNAKIDYTDGRGNVVTRDGDEVTMKVIPVGKKPKDAVELKGKLRVEADGTRYIQPDIDPTKPESAQFITNMKDIIVQRKTPDGVVDSEINLGAGSRQRLKDHLPAPR